ncbi:MAG TPA: helix-turn-helix domain-containing protein [Patescibacteria group bacterium]|nr:helix-turn-helix domain-containing protein [Patescibacteria group bacterium]
MTHIEIYTIGGRKYKYEVTNFRTGNKVKHKKKYLGAVEPINRKLNKKGGRKAKLKVRKLSTEESVFVKKSLRHSGSYVKDRARIIELSSEGKTIKQICEILKTDKKKVGRIINLFNEEGIKVFERKKNPGRPKRITQEERAKIISYLNTEPSKLGLHFNNWSRNKLAQFAKQNNIKISPSQIGRIIKKEEIKYKTKRSKMYSTDKNFLKNIRD